MFKKRTVYLDAAASAPTKKRAQKVLEQVSRDHFANPGSIHSAGVQAKEILEQSRQTVADVFDVRSQNIVFTGSSSESIVLALEGALRAWQAKYPGKKTHAVTTDVEHPAVYATLDILKSLYDFEYSIVEAGEDGVVDPKQIGEALQENTVFVSVVYVDSVFGAIAPVKEITKTVRHFKKHTLGDHSATYPLVHVDASQALLLQDCSFERTHVDLLSANAQKIGGPKGVGFLVYGNRVSLQSIIPGGGQESGLRGGTPNVPGIASLAAVLEDEENLADRYAELKTYLLQKLENNEWGIECVNTGETYSPHIVSLVVPQLESELVVIELDARGVYVSSQSACSDEQISPRAKRLEALGGGSALLRVSFHHRSSEKDIDRFVDALQEVMQKYKTAGFYK